jgi:hypothetical protein
MKSRFLLAVLVVAAALLAGSCDINEYCINCKQGENIDSSTDNGDGSVDNGDGGSGNGDSGPCVPDGEEHCDGADNDCDGTTDESDALIGSECGDSDPPCSLGVWECVAGDLACTGTVATAELCDGIDNDCDTVVDDGDPEGGNECGSDFGECRAGLTQCVAGDVVCVGWLGTPGEDPEICDGKDNDCDENFDEFIPAVPCGFNGVGECRMGTEACNNGVPECTGAVYPTFELCDGLDQDCNGQNTNTYDLMTDVRNCGTCGFECAVPNARPKCEAGNCEIGSCLPDYWDVDDLVAGCEYGPCQFQGYDEVCNLDDDDCDGITDEFLTPPDICPSLGACSTTTVDCGPAGWSCTYGPEVSLDADGLLTPETQCDDIDNDCDGAVDEGHPTKGDACDDGLNGICRSSGHFICDPSDEEAPVICDYEIDGQTAGAEVCNHLDDDCNGIVDDGKNTGDMDGQEWVTMDGAGGVEIMQYEASRPDAEGANPGSENGWVCSRAGALPWTNVTPVQAEAACAAIGARLCSEQEWHRACSGIAGTVYPLPGPVGTLDRVLIEAEDHYLSVSRTSTGATAATRGWMPDYIAGYSGISALRASPDTGANLADTAAVTEAPSLHFLVNFQQTATHYVWVRAYAGSSSNDRFYFSTSATLPGGTPVSITISPQDSWQWERSAGFAATAGVPQYINLFMREDGAVIDSIVITRDGTNIPTETTGPGGTWSYATNPTVEQVDTCNSDGYDTSPGGSDDDEVIAAGSMPSCYTDGPGANDLYDMSGNVKEWTAPRVPDSNPARGGASNNLAAGTTCSLSFTSAADDFFFPNVGFRCCR